MRTPNRSRNTHALQGQIQAGTQWLQMGRELPDHIMGAPDRAALADSISLFMEFMKASKLIRMPSWEQPTIDAFIEAVFDECVEAINARASALLGG